MEWCHILVPHKLISFHTYLSTTYFQSSEKCKQIWALFKKSEHFLYLLTLSFVQKLTHFIYIFLFPLAISFLAQEKNQKNKATDCKI